MVQVRVVCINEYSHLLGDTTYTFSVEVEELFRWFQGEVPEEIRVRDVDDDAPDQQTGHLCNDQLEEIAKRVFRNKKLCKADLETAKRTLDGKSVKTTLITGHNGEDDELLRDLEHDLEL